MKRWILYFCMMAGATSCSRYPADVEKALKLAGENRAELENVLAYYSRCAEDRLKLKSAYFLIAHMPYHYTLHDPEIEAFKLYLAETDDKEKAWDNFKNTYEPTTAAIRIEQDVEHVTAEFLIRHIDFSFKVWQESPWGQYLSFDDFCEEILPYRLDNEPLENWKEEYYAAFRPVIDTMAQNNNLQAVFFQLLEHIQEQGWSWESNFNGNGLGASMLLHKRFGNCKEQAEFITYMFRSVGIPAGIEMVIQNPDDYFVRQHIWN